MKKIQRKNMKTIICLIMMIVPMLMVSAIPIRTHNRVIHHPVHHTPVHHHRHVHRPCHHHSPIIPIVSGVVGGMIANAIVNSTTPTVIDTTPVVVQSTPVVVRGVNTVWQPGHYEDRVQPDGTIIRVWVPGQYVVIP
jgi:hypothetical protein